MKGGIDKEDWETGYIEQKWQITSNGASWEKFRHVVFFTWISPGEDSRSYIFRKDKQKSTGASP